VLVGAVSDNDEDTEGTAQILHGFSLTGTGGTSGRTTVHHTESLGKSHVTSIGEGSNAKTFLGTEELILIEEFDISNSDSNSGLLDFPVTSSVLKPIEIELILEFITLHESDDFIEFVTLVNLNGHESLNLGTLELVKFFIQAHHSKILHDVVVVLLLLVKIRSLVGLLALGKSLLKAGSPKELDTEQSNLRLVVINEFAEGHREAVLCGRLANLTHRLLHLLLEFVKPVLNLTFGFDTLVKSDILSGASEVLVDNDDHLTVLLIESNRVNGVEKLLEIVLDSVGVRALGQNLEQISI